MCVYISGVYISKEDNLTLVSSICTIRYLRIVDSEGKQVVSGTRQITSRKSLNQVKQVMREALEDLGINVPDYL